MKSIYILFKQHLNRYPTPFSLNFNWGYGSVAGVFLIVQLITGALLSFYYVAHPDMSFFSIERTIMRDVHYGWLARYIHMNGASFFFFVIYLHIARALYYRSYITNSAAWYTGLLLFVLSVIVAFLGYVLPWSQMSYWAATVITNLFSSIPLVGKKIVYWIWGGYSVSETTLKRFFTLHYILSFVLVFLSIVHLIFVHIKGSTKPLCLDGCDNSLTFTEYFTLKDLFGFFVIFFAFLAAVLLYPLELAHPDQFIKADVLVTPKHIVPEWYFLPFYAILRSVPSKGLGVLLLFLSILVFFFLPKIDASKLALYPRFNVYYEFLFYLFIYVFLMLGYLGAMPATEPYVLASKIFTIFYFLFFILLYICSRASNAILLKALKQIAAVPVVVEPEQKKVTKRYRGE